MHKTHIYYQKNNAKKIFFTNLPTLFFRTVTGNKQYFFLGLRIWDDLRIRYVSSCPRKMLVARYTYQTICILQM